MLKLTKEVIYLAELKNVRHERFAVEYVKSLNATHSYLECYPNVKFDTARINGSKLLSHTNVKARIEELMNKDKDNRIASAEEVLRLLTSIARGETTEEQVTSKGTIVEVDSNTQARLKALDLLAKRYGLLTNKLEVEGNVGVTILNDMPFDEEE